LDLLSFLLFLRCLRFGVGRFGFPRCLYDTTGGRGETFRFFGNSAAVFTVFTRRAGFFWAKHTTKIPRQRTAGEKLVLLDAALFRANGPPGAGRRGP